MEITTSQTELNITARDCLIFLVLNQEFFASFFLFFEGLKSMYSVNILCEFIDFYYSSQYLFYHFKPTSLTVFDREKKIQRIQYFKISYIFNLFVVYSRNLKLPFSSHHFPFILAIKTNIGNIGLGPAPEYHYQILIANTFSRS